MADSLFHQKLMVELELDSADIVASLINGSCDDFAEYKFKSGILEGLELARKSALKVKQDILGE